MPMRGGCQVFFSQASCVNILMNRFGCFAQNSGLTFASGECFR